MLARYALAAPLCQGAGDNNCAAKAFNALGQLYEERGERARAADSFRLALQSALSANNNLEKAVALFNIAEHYLAAGNRREAVYNFRQALQAWRNAGSPEGEARALKRLAEVAPTAAAPAAAASASERPELVLQNGHSGEVRVVSYSPDGRLAATGGADDTVKIWETATWRNLRTLVGHSDTVNSVAWSPDGRRLASGSDDNTCKTWDVETGRELHTFTGHDSDVNAVAFSPDGHTLATGGNNGRLRLWDADDEKKWRDFQVESNVVELAFSPDGRLLAAAGNAKKVVVFDLAEGKVARTLTGFNSSVSTVAFGRDGRLATGSGDNKVRLWDLQAGGEPTVLLDHTGAVYTVAFSRDGRLLASGSTDNTAKLWDAQTGKVLKTFRGHDDTVNSVAFSADGSQLLTGSDDVTARLWDVGTGRHLRRLGNEQTSVFEVAYSPDGRWLAQSMGNSVVLWETATGRAVHTFNGHTDTVTGINFSPDGHLLATASGDNTIKLWDVDALAEARTLGGHTKSANGVAFSPDGRLVASCADDRKIIIWDAATGARLKTLTGHTGIVYEVAFSGDGRYLASGGDDKVLRIWDTATWENVRTLAGHTDTINSLAFSPDRRTVATAGEDQTIKLWDAEKGGEPRTLVGHASAVNEVAFSPDGRTLASIGTEDKSVKLWDVASGAGIRTLSGHTSMVNDVAFSPDGRTLASGGYDGSTRIWDPDTGELLATLASTDLRGNWVVSASDGRFDGSPDAWGQILWRFSPALPDVMPVEAFFNEFFSPGILADVFAGRVQPVTQDIAKKDRRQPDIKLTLAPGQLSPAGEATARELKVEVEIAEAKRDAEHPTEGGGARDVRLFRNGSLVKVWPGDAFALGEKEGCRQAGPGRVTCEAKVTLVAGDNRLSAYAFNRDNVKSADYQMPVRGADALKRRGTAYVIAVGVNEYENRAFNLRYAVADAEDFSAQLVERQRQLQAYAPAEIVPVYNRDVTRGNLLAVLGRLAGDQRARLQDSAAKELKEAFARLRRAEPEDAVVIYYAGHGSASEDGSFYMIPYDIKRKDEAARLDAASLRRALSDSDLEAALAGVDAGQMLLVIDACHAGQFLETGDTRRGPVNSRGLGQLAYEKGMYVLTAAQGRQAALEVSSLRHGLLTYALIEEGILGGRADRSAPYGKLFMREWLDYATDRVPQMQVERAKKRNIGDDEGGATAKGAEEAGVQRPRGFYRREPEGQQFVVANVEPAHKKP
jgi:WD40 repeat protein